MTSTALGGGPLSESKFRELCEELVDVCDNPSPPQYKADVLNRARTELATPPPKPPTDEEPFDLWQHWRLPSAPPLGGGVNE